MSAASVNQACDHCGTRFRDWKPVYYTHPQEDSDLTRCDGPEHSPARCRDVLKSMVTALESAVESALSPLINGADVLGVIAVIEPDARAEVERWELECRTAHAKLMKVRALSSTPGALIPR